MTTTAAHLCIAETLPGKHAFPVLSLNLKKNVGYYFMYLFKTFVKVRKDKMFVS